MQQISFGARLRGARKKSGLASKALAKQAGLSAAYLSQLENGVRDNPSPETAKKLAAELAVDLDWLLGRDSTPDPIDQGNVPLATVTGLTEEESAALSATAPRGVRADYERLTLFSAGAEEVALTLVAFGAGHFTITFIHECAVWLVDSLKQIVRNRNPKNDDQIRVLGHLLSALDADKLTIILERHVRGDAHEPTADHHGSPPQKESKPDSHGSSLSPPSTPFTDPWQADGWTGFSDDTLRSLVATCMEVEDYKAASVLSAELARRKAMGMAKRE